MAASLQHGPERLDSVGVRHAVHILAHTVVDAPMVRDTSIGSVVFRVDRDVSFGGRCHAAIECTWYQAALL